VNYVNQEGYTPLLYSVKFGDIKAVKILLKSQETNINFINKQGYTPLMFAAKYGHFEIVKILTKDKRINLLINNKDLTAGDYANINFLKTKDRVYEHINKYLFDLMQKEITKMLSKYDGKRKSKSKRKY
jgi:ankyrin repeat protein